MKNNLLKQYTVALYFCTTVVAFAQPGTNDGTGSLEDTDPTAPIDNYIWVLAIVGLFFVFIKFRSMRNISTQN